MKKIEEKIITYLKKQFGNKTFIRTKMIDGAGAEVYGFNGMTILVKKSGAVISYCPMIKDRVIKFK